MKQKTGLILVIIGLCFIIAGIWSVGEDEITRCILTGAILGFFGVITMAWD